MPPKIVVDKPRLCVEPVEYLYPRLCFLEDGGVDPSDFTGGPFDSLLMIKAWTF